MKKFFLVAAAVLWSAASFATEIVARPISSTQLSLKQKIETLRTFLSDQSVDVDKLHLVLDEAWLQENANLEEDKKRLGEELLELQKSQKEKPDPSQVELLSLKLQFLDLTPEQRRAMMADAEGRGLAKESAEQGRLQQEEAQKAIEQHRVKEEELRKKFNDELQERRKSLLAQRRLLETNFSELAKRRKVLAEVQTELSARLNSWWTFRDTALEKVRLGAGTGASRGLIPGWDEAVGEVSGRLRTSNQQVVSEKALRQEWLSNVAFWPKQLDKINLGLFDRDSPDTKALIDDIRAKKVEFESAYLSFVNETAGVFASIVGFQTKYRQGLLGLRSELLREEGQKRWRKNYLLSKQSPFSEIRLEVNTLLSKAKFGFWKFGSDFDTQENARLSWDQFLWKILSWIGRLAEAIIALLAAFLLIRTKKKCIKWLHTKAQSPAFTRPVRRRLGWMVDLLDDFYIFIILLVVGKFGHNMAVAAGFKWAPYVYPYLKLFILYFLGRGFIQAVGPLISQRKARAWGKAQAEVLAIEMTFRLVPSFILTYWVAWQALELFLQQTLGASVLEKWLQTIGWSMFPLFLLMGVWRHREDWRTTCSRVSESAIWQKILSQSRSKLWEPMVLLFGGGLGVYLVAWRRISARIAESEVTKSFQAVVSRALLERAQRRRLVKLNYSTLPEGYADSFGRRSLWKPEWHVTVGSQEDELKKAYEARRSESEGTTIILLGERGIGKSALIQAFLQSHAGNKKLAHLTSQHSDSKFALDAMSQQLLGKSCSTYTELIAELLLVEPSIMVLENLERCILRKIEGFDTYSKVLDVIVKTSGQHMWITTMIEETWSFVRHAFAGADCFSRRVKVRGMSETQIAELISKRHPLGHIPLDFSAISFSEARKPRWAEKMSEEERRKKLYFRILWDYANGNPRDAMYFWGTSVHFAERKAKISLFDVPDDDVLENLSDRTLMFLAAIVEHNGLSLEDMCSVMNEEEDNVRRMLEALSPHGLIYTSENESSLHLESFWTRALKTYLVRRHLLITEAA